LLVAASTDCFKQLGFQDAIQKLVDLEYSMVDVVLCEDGNQIKPSMVHENLEAAITLCTNTLRLGVVSYDVRINATGDRFYEQFASICKLAKATRVVSISIPSAELGTPFNQEVEHLQKLVQIAETDGIVVSLKNQIGCLTEDPDTVSVLCNNVDGLKICLDISQYQCGPYVAKGYDKLLPYINHAILRDASDDTFQVRVGQGVVDYGRLINQLGKQGFRRALSVQLDELPDVDHDAEMRKMRLLLESML